MSSAILDTDPTDNTATFTVPTPACTIDRRNATSAGFSNPVTGDGRTQRDLRFTLR